MNQSVIHLSYDELMGISKDYIDTVNSVYQLHTNDIEEINKIYQQVKTNLIETKYFSVKKNYFDDQ